jgi:hypothetical protein
VLDSNSNVSVFRFCSEIGEADQFPTIPLPNGWEYSGLWYDKCFILLLQFAFILVFIFLLIFLDCPSAHREIDYGYAAQAVSSSTEGNDTVPTGQRNEWIYSTSFQDLAVGVILGPVGQSPMPKNDPSLPMLSSAEPAEKESSEQVVTKEAEQHSIKDALQAEAEEGSNGDTAEPGAAPSTALVRQRRYRRTIVKSGSTAAGSGTGGLLAAKGKDVINTTSKVLSSTNRFITELGDAHKKDITKLINTTMNLSTGGRDRSNTATASGVAPAAANSIPVAIGGNNDNISGSNDSDVEPSSSGALGAGAEDLSNNTSNTSDSSTVATAAGVSAAPAPVTSAVTASTPAPAPTPTTASATPTVTPTRPMSSRLSSFTGMFSSSRGAVASMTGLNSSTSTSGTPNSSANIPSTAAGAPSAATSTPDKTNPALGQGASPPPPFVGSAAAPGMHCVNGVCSLEDRKVSRSNTMTSQSSSGTATGAAGAAGAAGATGTAGAAGASGTIGGDSGAANRPRTESSMSLASNGSTNGTPPPVVRGNSRSDATAASVSTPGVGIGSSNGVEEDEEVVLGAERFAITADAFDLDPDEVEITDFDMISDTSSVIGGAGGSYIPEQLPAGVTASTSAGAGGATAAKRKSSSFFGWGSSSTSSTVPSGATATPPPHPPAPAAAPAPAVPIDPIFRITNPQLATIGKQLKAVELKCAKAHEQKLKDWRTTVKPELETEIGALEKQCAGLMAQIEREAARGPAHITALEGVLKELNDELDVRKRRLYHPESTITLGSGGVYVGMNDFWLQLLSGHYVVDLLPQKDRPSEISIILSGTRKDPQSGVTVQFRVEGFKLAGDKGKNIPKFQFENLKLAISLNLSMVLSFDPNTKKWSLPAKNFNLKILSFKGPYGISRRYAQLVLQGSFFSIVMLTVQCVHLSIFVYSLVGAILSLVTPIIRNQIASNIPHELGNHTVFRV